jgi:hypothetical protein
MSKGEKVLAQSKRTAPPPNFKKNFSIGMIFQIDISLCSKGGESSISKKQYLKTLLNTKRRNLSRGVLFKSKEKHLK